MWRDICEIKKCEMFTVGVEPWTKEQCNPERVRGPRAPRSSARSVIIVPTLDNTQQAADLQFLKPVITFTVGDKPTTGGGAATCLRVTVSTHR